MRSKSFQNCPVMSGRNTVNKLVPFMQRWPPRGSENLQVPAHWLQNGTEFQTLELKLLDRVICPGDVGNCGVPMKGSWSRGFDLQEDSPSNLIRALLSSCIQREARFLDLQSRGLEVCIFLESLHPRTAWLSTLGSSVWSSGSVLESQGCRAERSFFAFDLATSLPNM